MKKITTLIVEKRFIILTIMLILTLVCGYLTFKVSINSDMTKYLPDDSSMKKGMDIMESEFPVVDNNYTIRVMFKDLSPVEKNTVLNQLSEITNVESVIHEDNSNYNKDEYTLYVVHSKYNYDTKEEKQLEKDIIDLFSDYQIELKNDNISSPAIPTFVVFMAFIIMMIVLFISCKSFIEPFLFLITIGIAIIINLGTNIFMGEISDITFGIVAILQLVLSMDYSIILMNQYRQELLKNNNRKEAMISALHNSLATILSSSLTTIVGLLMLIFMSFKIGADLGIVLSKGVLCSLICVFFILPTLILLFSSLIEKTSRKKILKNNNYLVHLGNFEITLSKFITVFFILLLIGSFLIQTTTGIAYTLNETDKIAEVFVPDNTIVLVYENKDDDKITEIAIDLSEKDEVNTCSSYSTTIGKGYTSTELYSIVSNMGSSFMLTPDLLNIVFYNYYKDDETVSLTLKQFVDFINNDISKNIIFSSFIDKDVLAEIKTMKNFVDKDAIQTPLTANLLALNMGMDVNQITQLYMMRFGTSYTPESSMSITEFINFVIDNVLTNETYAKQFDENTIKKLYSLKGIIDIVISEKKLSSKELNLLLSNISSDTDEKMIDLLYLFYASKKYSNNEWTLSIDELFNYLYTDLINDSRFSNLINEEMLSIIQTNKVELDNNIAQLKGPNYSRLIITSSLPGESEQTISFIASLEETLNNNLDSDYHLVGNSIMVYEMYNSFDNELLLITILTAVAIFIVVALTFKSLIIPLILVLLVQCGVFITISVIGLQGNSMFYLALLIVECILMGSTIDYGILFTNHYRENRKFMSIKESLITAYKDSIPTILTSGSIMVFVTAIVGRFFGNPTIEEIVSTISIGCFSAILLILFVLPGIIITFDKFITKNKSSIDSIK